MSIEASETAMNTFRLTHYFLSIVLIACALCALWK